MKLHKYPSGAVVIAQNATVIIGREEPSQSEDISDLPEAALPQLLKKPESLRSLRAQVKHYNPDPEESIQSK